MDVDGPRVAEPVVAPHAVEDLLTRERESRSLGEELQQIEFLARERHRRLADAHLAAADVDRDRTDLQDLGRGRRAVGAPQHGLHPGDQLGGRKRFRDVVVRAELEAEDPVDLGVTGGQEDDRDRRGLAQPPAHLEAVDVGKADVEHDEPGPVRADRGDDVLAGGGLHHPETVAAEVELDQVGNVGLVVDDEDGPSLHALSIVPVRVAIQGRRRV